MSENGRSTSTEELLSRSRERDFSDETNTLRTNGNSSDARSREDLEEILEFLPSILRPHLKSLEPLGGLIGNWLANESPTNHGPEGDRFNDSEISLLLLLQERLKGLFDRVFERSIIKRVLQDYRESSSALDVLRKGLVRLLARESYPERFGGSKGNGSEKELTLQEYQHRVKNHLQQVISLIELKHRNDDSDPDHLLEQTVGLLQDFISLNKNLDDKRTSKETPLNMEARIRKNLESLRSMFGPDYDGTEFDVSVEPIEISRNKVVPLGLIVNELSMNSFQHGFKSEEISELSISLTADANQGELRVQDNGSGLPEEFEWERSSSGLHLVKELTEKQLMGSLEPTNNGDGTGWIVRFPLADSPVRA